MADELKAIRDAWEKRDARGLRSSSGKASLEDDAKVYAMADKYVSAHKDDFAGWDNLSVDLLVKSLEEARDKGDDESEQKIQIWLWHRFEPQNIGGPATVTVRKPN